MCPEHLLYFFLYELVFLQKNGLLYLLRIFNIHPVLIRICDQHRATYSPYSGK